MLHLLQEILPHLLIGAKKDIIGGGYFISGGTFLVSGILKIKIKKDTERRGLRRD